MDAVCDILRTFNFKESVDIDPTKREQLQRYVFSEHVIAKITEDIETNFFSRMMGFNQLFDAAYRSAAEYALREKVLIYSSKGNSHLSPSEYFDRNYLALFEALGLSLKSLQYIDGNLYTRVGGGRFPERPKIARRNGRLDQKKTGHPQGI